MSDTTESLLREARTHIEAKAEATHSSPFGRRAAVDLLARIDAHLAERANAGADDDALAEEFYRHAEFANMAGGGKAWAAAFFARIRADERANAAADAGGDDNPFGDDERAAYTAQIETVQGHALREEAENARLQGCIAAVWCPVCTRRVWLDGDGSKPRTLALHMRKGRTVTRCPATSKTVSEALAMSLAPSATPTDGVPNAE